MINQIKTVILLGALTALLLFIGSLFGSNGLTIAFIFVLIMNVGSYWFSDKIVLAMYRAKEVTKKEAHDLYEIVEEVIKEAKIPMPKVYIIPNSSPNAFATGRNPKHAAIAATQGILSLLTKEELKGVIAHEVAHIKNRDILISTITATIAGVISYVAMMARFAAIFGGLGGKDRSGNNMLSMLFLAILAPIMALIIQLAISRSREYQADESGAKIIKNPNSLASALTKLESSVKIHPMRTGSEATAHMFIVNPFSGRALMSLFSTHPPVAQRVKKLKALNIS